MRPADGVPPIGAGVGAAGAGARPGDLRRFSALVLGLALAYALVAALSIWLTRQPGSIASIWYPNALVVLALVQRPARQWPGLLLAMVAGNLLANVLAGGDDWTAALKYLPPNLLEVLLAAALLQGQRCRQQPMQSPRLLLALLWRGALLPAVAAATLAALSLAPRPASGLVDAGSGLVWLAWFESAAIGAVSGLPLGLLLIGAPWAESRTALSDHRLAVLAPLAIGLSLLCMAHMPYPFVYMLLPMMAAALLLAPAAVALLTLLLSLSVALALGSGVLVPPPMTERWQLAFVYLAVAAVLVPPLLLSSAVAALREEHQRLAERTAALQRANEGLQQFVHAASHDLREPLNGILQFGGLAQQQGGAALPPALQQWLDLAIGEARRMRQVLDDVLQYSQVQHTELPPPQPVALAEVLERVLARLTPQQRRCISLPPELQSGVLPALPPLAGHAPLLVLLFGHLLDNALKFTAAGRPPEVSLALGRVGDSLVVEVADRGIGIADSALPRLFKPFQRLHRRSEHPGTGLGLAICQQVVRAHAGDIAIAPRPGGGSVVRLRLPLCV